jgi:hypothetical protein
MSRYKHTSGELQVALVRLGAKTLFNVRAFNALRVYPVQLLRSLDHE